MFYVNDESGKEIGENTNQWWMTITGNRTDDLFPYYLERLGNMLFTVCWCKAHFSIINKRTNDRFHNLSYILNIHNSTAKITPYEMNENNTVITF